MSKRFFAFGCSFTNYSWPTWADIIAKIGDYEEYQNWGISGMGNLGIACRVAEADARYHFNKNDTVYIMWSNVAREDRFTNIGWKCPGNIFTQAIYPPEWVEKYVDIDGCYIRDLAQIHNVVGLLESKECKYKMSSMIDIDTFDQYNFYQNSRDLSSTRSNNMLDVYQETLSKLKPSVYNIIFNYNWNSRPWPFANCHSRPDHHPLPIEHLEFVQKVFPEYSITEDIYNMYNNLSKEIAAERCRNPDSKKRWIEHEYKGFC